MMTGKPSLWIGFGLVLVLLGVQLLAVEAYVLAPETVRLLDRWFGPPADTASGAIRKILLTSDNIARQHVEPPAWLAWAAVSAGVVMLAHGLIQRRARR